MILIKIGFQTHFIRVIKFKLPKNPVHASGRDFYFLLKLVKINGQIKELKIDLGYNNRYQNVAFLSCSRVRCNQQ